MQKSESDHFQIAGAALIFVIEFILAFYGGPQWAWVLGLSLLLLLCLLIGEWLSKMAMGIFISERNLISLSRLQMVAWSVVIFSAYLIGIIQRIVHAVPNPFALEIDPYLWSVLGISTASFVGTPLVLSPKMDTKASPGAITTAANLLQQPPGEVQQCAIGKLYSNPSPKDARFSDIFQGDEIGNTAQVDVSKVQMVIITVLLIGAYAVDLWAKLGSAGDFKAFTMPTFSASQLQLLGVSHAGYLVFKAVNHTTGINQ